MKLLLFTKTNSEYYDFILRARALFDDVKVVFPSQHPKRSAGDYEEFYQECREYAPDVIISFYYNRIIQSEILGIPKVVSANFHGSVLPNYAGSHALNWQIINGESESGVTLHELSREIDGGKIILQKTFPILESDDANVVLKKGIQCSCEILNMFYDQLSSEEVVLVEQEISGTEFRCRKRRPCDGEIKKTMTPKEVCNLVRALVPPWPCAFYVDKNDKKIVIEDMIDVQTAAQILESM